jgi:hypothetical protein
MAPALAHAHLFTCEKTVNGSSYVELSSYPAALNYHFAVINSHPTSPSTASSVSDPALASLGYSFSPAPPFTLPVGGSHTDSFSVPLASYEECQELAAKDGVADDRFVNVFTVTWHGGSAQCSATVVCREPPPPPPPPMDGEATRTMGFFKTHEQALAACLESGPVELGIVTITSLESALGLLWGSPAVFETGQRRNSLDRARFLLARQALVGSCNVRLFGTEPEPSDLLSDAIDALAGTDCELIRMYAEAIDAYNNSGTDESFPDGFIAGPATPRHAASIAYDPTTPSGQQCSQ